VRRWYISFREKNRRKKTEDVERRKETEHVETKKEKQCVETRENYQQSMLRNRKETWGKKIWLLEFIVSRAYSCHTAISCCIASLSANYLFLK
jgi:hypothetical protein